MDSNQKWIDWLESTTPVSSQDIQDLIETSLQPVWPEATLLQTELNGQREAEQGRVIHLPGWSMGVPSVDKKKTTAA